MSRAVHRLVPFAAGAVLLAAYLAIFLPHLPNAQGLWAADYYLHFPNLLVGDYWRANNGLFVAPWFNPAECGGVPYFADPNVGYYALPQFLSFVVTPGAAVRLTFAIFAALGFAGAYGLQRHAFQGSRAASVAAAGLFLFNSFYWARMLAGHLTFHAFMLAPALAWAVLPGPRSRSGAATTIARAGAAAAIVAYMFQSGMVHGLPPVALSVAIVGLLQALRFGVGRRPLVIAAIAIAGSLALSASKLVAELSFLSQFPRDLYPLPGIEDWRIALLIGPITLLGYAPEKSDWLVNSAWLQDRHEWEYGVSLAPFVLVGWAAALLAFRGRATAATPGRAALILILFALLSVPTALNVYSPDWNAFLKALPYFGNSSSLLRFLLAYILPMTVAAGLAIDRIAEGGSKRAIRRGLLAAAATLIAVGQGAATPKAYYDEVAFDATPYEAAAHRVLAGGRPPPVDRITDDLTGPEAGASVAQCYQPLFGYRLELFPRGALHAGPIFEAAAAPNLKNPACYVFPTENGCRPGDGFDRDHASVAADLAAYRPMPFQRSAAQSVADAVNLLALTTLVVFAGVAMTAQLLILARRR